MTATTTIHVWEANGHGKAPFRVVGVIGLPRPTLAEQNPMAYQGAMAEAGALMQAHGVSCGTCGVCSTAITQNFVIRSADGKRFVVGCDCVRKTGDAGLVDSLKLIQRKADRERREAARLAEWERTRPEREARQAADRERAERAAAERAARETIHREANGWLLAALRGQRGDFIQNMVAHLERASLADLSGRCIDIIGEIYARQTGGRAGSKAYKAALAEFRSRSSPEGQ